MSQQLIANSLLVSCVTVTAGAAGSSAINGSTLDFAGYLGGLISVQTGAIVSGAVTSIKFQHSDASDMTGAADVLGTSQTIADTDDDKVRTKAQCFGDDARQHRPEELHRDHNAGLHRVVSAARL